MDREPQVVNGKNTLTRKALRRRWIVRLAREVVFMQSRSRLTKTTIIHGLTGYGSTGPGLPGGFCVWKALKRFLQKTK